jgi:D-alanine-D-alanine ligase-like ATP-grasp enzyme
MFKILGYSTCSVDMIVDTDFNYHFLELNPVGQFVALSEFCNFNIEKYIAIKLIGYEKRNN